MELIRPLYFVKEEDILAWKNRNNLEFIECACRFTEEYHSNYNEDGNENRLPIIITTRFDKQGLIERFNKCQDEQLVNAIISKLYQMCYGVTLKNIKEKASTSDQTKC